MNKDYYEYLCKKIQWNGITPIADADDKYVQMTEEIRDRCLRGYAAAHDEDELIGVYAYRVEDQKENSRAASTLGYSLHIGDHKAVIGLSNELLSMPYPDFHDYVFLHELAHMADFGAGHGDTFQTRSNEILLNYYQNRACPEIRTDSADTATMKLHRIIHF